MSGMVNSGRCHIEIGIPGRLDILMGIPGGLGSWDVSSWMIRCLGWVFLEDETFGAHIPGGIDVWDGHS